MSLSFIDPAARRPLLLWIGVGGALIAALLGMLAPNGAAVWRVPSALRDRVSTALMLAGQPGLNVEMQGQRAVLTGIVEASDDVDAARNAALGAAGPGGPWAGGITSVDVSGISIGVFDRPYVWGVRRDGPRVVIAGAVPTRGVRAALIAAGHAAFQNELIVDNMHLAGGAPSPHFADVAVSAIQGVARLGAGEARIVDDQVAFIGDGTQQGVDALHQLMANPPAPYRLRMDVTIDGLDVNHPELQGLDLANGSAETCTQAFQRVMERNVINFPSGSATVDPSSRRLLDALASVALRCDRFSIEVAGHTDNNGAREMNMRLSQARADAVAAYLAEQGVARGRLAAHGYGPDRPRADNATPAGQAANRRIEFNVSG
ncbi:MAG: OmpA family protein [Proteobacteria bacterium]|nr:OmpA family protein [Pseudomonadota bacterium]